MTYSKIILDDRGIYYNPYASDCAECVYFDLITMTCKAFPKGIPVSLLSGDKKHREPWKSQKNKIVFEPK